MYQDYVESHVVGEALQTCSICYYPSTFHHFICTEGFVYV